MQDLLSLGISNVMMLFSSYSNPVETLKHAQRQGYRALDFMVTAMPFGTYSSEPKVCVLPFQKQHCILLGFPCASAELTVILV